MNAPTFKDSGQAFQEAIDAGRLSSDPKDTNYAGNYMYMGTWDGVDTFKNIDTREYIGPSAKAEAIVDALDQAQNL